METVNVQSKERNERYGVLITTKFHGCAMAQAVVRQPPRRTQWHWAVLSLARLFSPVSIFHKFSTPIVIPMLLRPSNKAVLLRISGGIGQSVFVTPLRT
jgi:hypothetical protein